MISRATMNLKPAVIELDVGPTSKCPLWVKSRHMQCTTAGPLYPPKRTTKLTTFENYKNFASSETAKILRGWAPGHSNPPRRFNSPRPASFEARRHGQHLSISVSSEKLRKVRISTITASNPTLSNVSGEVIVEIMSAPTSVGMTSFSVPDTRHRIKRPIE